MIVNLSRTLMTYAPSFNKTWQNVTVIVTIILSQTYKINVPSLDKFFCISVTVIVTVIPWLRSCTWKNMYYEQPQQSITGVRVTVIVTVILFWTKKIHASEA